MKTTGENFKKESAVEYVVKAKRKLGPAYDFIMGLVLNECKQYHWKIRVNPDTGKHNYECTKCGKISPCARKHCPECGADMVDNDGKIKRIK